MAAGPVSYPDYERLVYKPISLNSMGLPPKQVVPRRTVLLSRGTFIQEQVPGETLSKCHIDPQVEHEDLQGDMYIDKCSKKLFLVISLDTLVHKSEISKHK
jgi:hypothetical protein